MRYHERMVMLRVLDGLWKDHLLEMDHLKEGIGMRGYAQQDPLVAYKKESFEMFEAMMTRFQEDTVAVPLPDADCGAGWAAVDRGVRAGADGSGSAAGGERCAACRLHGAPREIAVPTRVPTTTIDALEKEFERKKQRELVAAGWRAAAKQRAGAAPCGEQGWRNDPCPCGSGRSIRSAMGRKLEALKGDQVDEIPSAC